MKSRARSRYPIGIRGEVTAPLARQIEFRSYHEHGILTIYEAKGLRNDQFLMLPLQVLSCRLSFYEKSHSFILQKSIWRASGAVTSPLIPMRYPLKHLGP